jgi:hypothetical protein
LTYRGTVIYNTNYESELIKNSILTVNKAYYSLQTILRSKQIHRNYKIRLYKTLIIPLLFHGSVILTLTLMRELMLYAFKRTILRRIYGQIQEKRYWRTIWNSEVYILIKDLNILDGIKIRRLG